MFTTTHSSCQLLHPIISVATLELSIVRPSRRVRMVLLTAWTRTILWWYFILPTSLTIPYFYRGEQLSRSKTLKDYETEELGRHSPRTHLELRSEQAVSLGNLKYTYKFHPSSATYPDGVSKWLWVGVVSVPLSHVCGTHAHENLKLEKSTFTKCETRIFPVFEK